MTVTFASIDSSHNGWTLIEQDVAICACGYAMTIPDFMDDMRPEDAIDELQISHKEHERREWLQRNGYGPIDARWATCVYCGCIVGMIDEHRTVCP